jgi:hypothetical protein
MFFILTSIVVLALVSVYLRQFTKKLLNENAFVLPAQVKILVAGDSHPETAIDPRFISGTENVAKSGENFFYSLYKLRLILDKNPQIRNLVLGFSYHNFAKEYQESFLFGDKVSSCGGYYYLFDDEALNILKSYNSGYIVNRLKAQFGVPIQVYNNAMILKLISGKELKKKDIAIFGEYNQTYKHDLEQKLIDIKIKKYYLNSEQKYTGTSPLMATSLHNIISLCQAKHINVYLVNLPLFDGYKRMVPPEAITDFRAIAADLIKRYDNITILDWSDMQLDPGKYYDGDHVNAYGAEAVSRKLADYLGSREHSHAFSKP